MGSHTPAVVGNQRLSFTASTFKGQSSSDCHLGYRRLPPALRKSVPVCVQAQELSPVATGKRHSNQAGGLQANHVVPTTVHVEWFNKNRHLWTEVSSKDDLMKVIGMQSEKYTVVDFYAGWCSSCKAAYPALCKIAGSLDYTKDFHFVKANVQKRDIASYIRSLGVKGIPTIAVFSSNGEKLAHFGASFKKMNMVKANLTVMKANKGSAFMTDSNGLVIPRPESE